MFIATTDRFLINSRFGEKIFIEMVCEFVTKDLN